MLRAHQDATQAQQEAHQQTVRELLRLLQGTHPNAPIVQPMTQQGATDDATGRAPTPAPKRNTRRDTGNLQRILSYLESADMPQTPHEIGEALAIPNARSALMRLRERGRIERDDDGRYRLAESAT
jgi:hypothetical protein